MSRFTSRVDFFLAVAWSGGRGLGLSGFWSDSPDTEDHGHAICLFSTLPSLPVKSRALKVDRIFPIKFRFTDRFQLLL